MEVRMYFKRYSSETKKFELCDKGNAQSVSVFIETGLDTPKVREKILAKVQEINSKFSLTNEAKGRADGVKGVYLNFSVPKYETVTL